MTPEEYAEKTYEEWYYGRLHKDVGHETMSKTTLTGCIARAIRAAVKEAYEDCAKLCEDPWVEYHEAAAAIRARGVR